MVWYGAADPRGKLDFFEGEGGGNFGNTLRFFGVFLWLYAYKNKPLPQIAVTLTATAIQPVCRYSLYSFNGTHIIAESQ
jgi:hypothetical protein